MASGDRWDRVGRVTRNVKQRRDETEGAMVARKRTQTKGKRLGPICLPFGEASAGYLYESESAAIQCTLHRERGGESESESRKSSRRRQSARRRMRRSSGIQIKNRECIVCQGATAGARSKGAAVVEVRCKGNEKGS